LIRPIWQYSSTFSRFGGLFALVACFLAAYLRAEGDEPLTRVSCEISDDPALAARAASWLAGFHADVHVESNALAVILTADGWTEAELDSLWRSALANERLFDDAVTHRAAVLRVLVA
jgi:hypothetical protein